MLDIDLAIAFGTIVLAGLLSLAILEWFDRDPPGWVVKVRMWMNRRR